MVRPLLVLQRGLWGLGLAVLILAGCGRVGVRQVPLAPAGEPFERALMAYIRGELAQARADLLVVLDERPEDGRAIDLFQAVAREHGRGPRAPVSLPRALPEGPLSPADLLRLVLERNPEIRKALWQVVEARGRLREVHLSMSPEFSLLSRFHPLGVFVSLSDMILETLLRRPAAKQQAEAEVLAAVAAYARVRTAVLERALAAYLDCMQAQALAEPLAAEWQSRQEQVRLARLRVQAGSLPQHALLTLEQDVLAVEQKRAEASGQQATALALLNSLLGRPVQEPLPLRRQRVVVEPVASVPAVIQTAQAGRPEIDEAQARAAAARGRLADVAGVLPRVELRASYGVSTSEGRGDFLEGVSVGGRLSMPLLFWPLRAARTAREAALVEQLDLEVARLLSVIAVEAVSAHARLTLALAERRTAEKRLEVARETRRAARVVLQRGEGGEPEALPAAEALHAAARQRLLVQDANVQRAALQVQRSLGVLPERVALVETPLAEAPSLPPPGEGRALWVWRPTFLERPEEMEFFLDFAEARLVSSVFMFTSTGRLLAAPQAFRVFLSLAHQRGLRVHALNGEPGWVLPGEEQGLSAFLDAVLQYNRVQPLEARFDAVHLDIEPHALPAWKAGHREELAGQYLASVQRSRAQVQAAGLHLVLDVPVGFERLQLAHGSLLQAVLALADQVVLMAYYPRPEQVIAASQAALRYAAEHGKSVWVGISADPADLPAAGLGETAEEGLERLLSRVAEALRTQAGWQGLALHDYDRWRRLILAYPARASQAEPEEPGRPARARRNTSGR
ncbi:MAG: TolC family protein [Candidatus Tectimicrobiota bacterium]